MVGKKGAGDLELSMQCLNLCLTSEPNHGAALNNLAVLQQRLGRPGVSKAYLTAAAGFEPDLPEPKYNLHILQQNYYKNKQTNK